MRHEHLTWSPSYAETPDTGAAQAASVVPPQHSHSHRSELTAQGPDAENTTPASCIVPPRSVDIQNLDIYLQRTYDRCMTAWALCPGYQCYQCYLVLSRGGVSPYFGRQVPGGNDE